MISCAIGHYVNFIWHYYHTSAHMKPEWPLTNKELVITRQKQNKTGYCREGSGAQDEQPGVKTEVWILLCRKALRGDSNACVQREELVAGQPDPVLRNQSRDQKLMPTGCLFKELLSPGSPCQASLSRLNTGQLILLLPTSSSWAVLGRGVFQKSL